MKAYLVSVPTASGTLELAGSLLDEGVQPEDVSVVIEEAFGDRLTDSSPAPSRASLEEDLVDDRRYSEDLSYAATHNPEMEPAREVTREALAPLFESEVGGGISTSSPRDSVSAVEEMDEASEISEELMHPLGARDVRTHGPRSFSEIDAEDVAGQWQKDSDRTGIHGYESGLGVGVLAALIPAIIPGVGVVMGDGDLASDLLGEEDRAMDEGLRPFLEAQGLEPKEALRFETTLSAGGGILEVAAASGEASARQIMKLLESVPGAVRREIEIV